MPRRVRELYRRYNQLYPGVNSILRGDVPVYASGEPVMPSGELVKKQGSDCEMLAHFPADLRSRVANGGHSPSLRVGWKAAGGQTWINQRVSGR